LIKDSNGDFIEDLTDCDGSIALIYNNHNCDVPMTTLAGTYGLVLGDLIVAKVKAINLIGSSPFSEPNIAGQTMMTVPGIMSSPTRGTSNSLTQIEVLWT
jgi:hypothetical protein